MLTKWTDESGKDDNFCVDDFCLSQSKLNPSFERMSC